MMPRRRTTGTSGTRLAAMSRHALLVVLLLATWMVARPAEAVATPQVGLKVKIVKCPSGTTVKAGSLCVQVRNTPKDQWRDAKVSICSAYLMFGSLAARKALPGQVMSRKSRKAVLSSLSNVEQLSNNPKYIS